MRLYGAVSVLRLVARQFDGTDTTRSHLRIVEIGADGEPLHVERVFFEPKRLTRRIKPPNPVGYFRHVIRSPVSSVQALRVEAVDTE